MLTRGKLGHGNLGTWTPVIVPNVLSLSVSDFFFCVPWQPSPHKQNIYFNKLMFFIVCPYWILNGCIIYWLFSCLLYAVIITLDERYSYSLCVNPCANVL